MIEWPDGRSIPAGLTITVQVPVVRREDGAWVTYDMLRPPLMRVTIEGPSGDVEPFLQQARELMEKTTKEPR